MPYKFFGSFPPIPVETHSSANSWSGYPEMRSGGEKEGEGVKTTFLSQTMCSVVVYQGMLNGYLLWIKK